MVTCECSDVHQQRRVVLTGGPGAGKTALLELIRQSFCAHVRVLPEAASVVFGGGFPREDDTAMLPRPGRLRGDSKGRQRTINRLQINETQGLTTHRLTPSPYYTVAVREIALTPTAAVHGFLLSLFARAAGVQHGRHMAASLRQHTLTSVSITRTIIM